MSLDNTGVDTFGSEDRMPSLTIRNGIRTYGPIALVGWIGFEIGRRKLARAYYCRDRSGETTSPTVEQIKTIPPFLWIWSLYMTSDDVIFQYCGLDTLFYLRFLRMLQKIAALGILMSAALFPVYYYASDDALDALYRMTLSHLSSDQPWRFWFTVATMYLMTAWTCFLLWREFQVFVKRRHEFMSRKSTQQYSVILNGLPKHLQTQQTLRNYLNLLFPRQVLHVYVALECSDLEKLVTERVKVRDKLEHALALSAKTGDRVLTRTRPCGDKVDAIELHQNNLKSLNAAVEMEMRSILRNQAAVASQMLEASMSDDPHQYQYTPTMGDRQVPTLQAVDDDSKVVESAYIKGLRSERKGIKNTGIMRSAGFVTFSSLKAAQSAQQVLQSSDPTKMHIEAAPHVDDVVWENVGVSYNTKSYWLLISVALTSAIILFWTIPTSFVVSLSKVKALSEKWAWLGRLVKDHPWIGSVLEQLSPLMLSVMSALAPIIFGILSKREGHASGSQVETSLLNKLVAYQVFLVFLLPIIGGTLIEALTGKSDDLKDVSKMLKIISEAIPQQSSFFVTYQIVQTFVNLTLEFLRVTPIIKAAIYSVFAPKLTPRQRQSPWFGLSPLSNPGDFGTTDGISQYYLVLIFLMVFCGVAPIMCYFSFLYLLLSDIVCRWGVLCVYDPSLNSDGAFFPSLYRFCIGALIFSQVIIATLMGTKEVPLPALFSLFLPFLTALFHLFINARYPRTAMNLPLDECVLIDSRRARQYEDLEKILEDMYKQPAMAERAPLEPDYQGLSSDPNEDNRVSSPPSEVC
uniref:CSC1/OSCA1-like 7TM region domain-containing protein n=1 Tax=Globisporangium ultimum (strain ATCC 200006 / CBS 805.95 / DAOM BR144) TaxID=431595 RepID=K3W856_GLOUD